MNPKAGWRPGSLCVINDVMDSISYSCGTAARLGDIVDVDGVKSIVEDVVVTKDQQLSWGLDEPGIMFKNAQMGLVFQSLEGHYWSEIRFVARKQVS